MNIFGSKDALIGPIELIFGAAAFLLGAMTRKAVGDSFGYKFSVIGCTAIGTLAFIIFKTFLPLKFALFVGIIGWIGGGLGGGLLLPDGESSDGGDIGDD